MVRPVYLADVVRLRGGWPIDLDAVAVVLALADAVLPGGRDHREPLTAEQLARFEVAA